MCILLDKDIILVDVKMIYNCCISQKSHVNDSKYIFKENKTLLFRLTDRRVSLRIMKQKSRARVYNHTHIHSHTHIYANRQMRRMHVKTHACTRAYARVYTHIHKVFFRDRRPEFVEALAAHCKEGWI